jgi:hypothetical protein
MATFGRAAPRETVESVPQRLMRPYRREVVGIVIEYHRKQKLLVATDIAIASTLMDESETYYGQ